MNEFCPNSCLFLDGQPCIAKECHHQSDIIYRQPIKATLGNEDIEILGENTNVIANYYGHEIGPTWYIRRRGVVSSIVYQNPLVQLKPVN